MLCDEFVDGFSALGVLFMLQDVAAVFKDQYALQRLLQLGLQNLEAGYVQHAVVLAPHYKSVRLDLGQMIFQDSLIRECIIHDLLQHRQLAFLQVKFQC